MMLETAWNLLESLNDDANQKSKDVWKSDANLAVRYQAERFKENFLALDKIHQDVILYWINHDDELLDYFECLSDNLLENIVCKG